MIDRIVHHADVIALKGASYRIKHTAIDTLPSVEADRQAGSNPVNLLTFSGAGCSGFNPEPTKQDCTDRLETTQNTWETGGAGMVTARSAG